MNTRYDRLCTLQAEPLAATATLRPTHPAGSALSYQELHAEVLRQLG